MNKTNVKANPSTTHRHDTPNNKTHIIKFRVTETEKMELEHTAKLLHLSLSTLIRRALHNAKIERTVVVAAAGRKPDRRFHSACPVQQGGRQPEPTCTTLQLRRSRHRTAPGETSGRTCRPDCTSGSTPRKFWVNCMATLKHIASKNFGLLLPQSA